MNERSPAECGASAPPAVDAATSIAPLRDVAVVLVEPAEPGNVGAVARSMWNLGAGDLRIVAPDPVHRAALLGKAARDRACHGQPVLAAARCFDDLRGALAGLGRAYAFSARVGKQRQPRSALSAAAAAIAADPTLRAALIFGREDSGLTTAEIEQAHELVTIPAPGADPVLNLSHATTIALWEVARARTLAPSADYRGRPRTATAEDRAALRDEFAALLTETGLPPGRHGDLHRRIVRRFVDLFDRAGGEHADFGMLRGVFVAFRRTVA
ncbi:MAG: hypothetical protein FJ293_17305, partial [Planctomycetes bacterium]|nr:hypothetical protein [Planctomycetota bacterium]